MVDALAQAGIEALLFRGAGELGTPSTPSRRCDLAPMSICWFAARIGTPPPVCSSRSGTTASVK